MDGQASAPSPLPEYVQRYLAGESMQAIARDHGVHRATLYRHMLADLGDQHEHIVTDMLITRIAEADQELDEARDACDIARAREKARFSRMDFERRRPSLYGQRTQVTHEVGPDLGDLLREANKRVAQRTHAAPLSASSVVDADIVRSQPDDVKELVRRNDD